MQSIIKTVALFSALAWASFPAAADIIQISFVEPIPVVNSAEPFEDVEATLTNLDTADPVFLNADNLNAPSDFQADDEFFTNVPISLDPGQTSGLISLFTLTMQPGTPSGSYFGSYQLYGGVGTANQFNFDPIGAASFEVVAGPTAVAVPEPPTLLLAGAMLVGLALLRRRGGHKPGMH